MKNEYYTNSNDYINRWVISYADFVTMLLALFMVMFAANSMGNAKVKDVNTSIQKVFSSSESNLNQKQKEIPNKELKEDIEKQNSQNKMIVFKIMFLLHFLHWLNLLSTSSLFFSSKSWSINNINSPYYFYILNSYKIISFQYLKGLYR